MQQDEVLLRLPLSSDAELRAVDALDRLLARHKVEQQAAGQARFALVEACLNAIEYGTASAEMDVRMAMRGGELQISVANPGLFQMQPSQPRRGHGLKIIQSFMDRVQYLTDGDITRVEMAKRVGAAQ